MSESLGRAVAGLDALWRRTTGDPAVCIAALDGPVDLSHPCFQGVSVRTLDHFGRSAASRPQGPAMRHGTMVGSVLFGSHRSNLPGVAPSCRALWIPIFEDGADGRIRPCSQLDLARAIDLALEAGADVINISGGQVQSAGAIQLHLAKSIEACLRKGALIVASAGNDGCGALHSPAAYPAALAVGARGSAGDPLEWSNWGGSQSNQGILAPGVGIPAAIPGGG